MISLTHERIDDDPPANRLTNCLTTDLTGNGHPDVIITAMGAELGIGIPGGRFVKAIRSRFQDNIFWYENPGWERHTLATERDLHLDVGAVLHDVDDDGQVDLVVGQAFGKSDIYWYEQTENPMDAWHQHFVTDRFEKYHDLAVGDVDDDGNFELVGLSQDAETVFYYDIPTDPTVEPWPEENLHIIDTGIRVEGLAIEDIDNDGTSEIIAGPNVYHRTASDSWEREAIATGWDDTRVEIADIDDDEEIEIILAEGDSPTYGTHPGRVAWFDPPDWEPTFLRKDLFCPHSLRVVDFTGNGLLDIFVAEMGLGENLNPSMYLYENKNDGNFEEHLISRGIETHEARVVDLTGNGRLDIVGKSYEPDPHVDIWYNEGL